MPRKWDDWRCYRCNQWQIATMSRAMHTTPSGMVVGVCATCLTQSTTRMHPSTRYVLILKNHTRYELDAKGAVVYRTDGPSRGWDYSGRWLILGFSRRHHSCRIITLDEAAAGEDIGQGWVHDLDCGTPRIWGSPTGSRAWLIRAVPA